MMKTLSAAKTATAKKIYILSDTSRLSKFSNIALIRKRDGERYILPAFESKQCIEYVKSKSKHPYYIIQTHMHDLKDHASYNTDVLVIKNDCSWDITDDSLKYDIISLDE